MMTTGGKVIPTSVTRMMIQSEAPRKKPETPPNIVPMTSEMSIANTPTTSEILPP